MKKLLAGIALGFFGIGIVYWAIPHLKWILTRSDQNPTPSRRHLTLDQRNRPEKTKPVSDSHEHSQKLLLGTWTYTQPLHMDSSEPSSVLNFAANIIQESPAARGVEAWRKMVLFANGHCQFYQALPFFPNWGKSFPCRWTIGTGKFADTGKRYWEAIIEAPMPKGFSYKYAKYDLILKDNTSAILYDVLGNDNLGTLSKNDSFPFSK